jgi:hypothetical protein
MARKAQTTTVSGVRIIGTDRMKSSFYGNPRFMVSLSNGTQYATAVDAGCAYGITNREYRENDCVVTLNSRSQIIGVQVTK